MEASIPVTATTVILQNGTAGTSTIYTDTNATVSVSGYGYDFVDNNDTNVDSSANKGTHSNFTAQQYGPDSILDTLTEENTGGGSLYASVRSKSWSAEASATQSHDVLLPPTIEAGDTILVFFVNDDDEVTSFPGGWTELYDEDAGTDGPTRARAR